MRSFSKLIIRFIGKIVVKSLIFWFKLFGKARVLFTDFLLLLALCVAGYNWFVYPFTSWQLWLGIIFLFVVSIWRWLVVSCLPVDTRAFPSDQREHLEVIIGEYKDLLISLDAAQETIDKFLSLELWQINDYADANIIKIKEFRKAWSEVIKTLSALSLSRKQFGRFFELNYKEEQDLFVQAFMIINELSGFLLLNSLRIIDQATSHPFIAEILDDSDDDLGLVKENFSSLTAEALHITEVFRVYLGIAYMKLLLNEKVGLIQKSDFKRVMKRLAAINSELAEIGIHNLGRSLLRIFKKGSYRVWFPLQKVVANDIGTIRLPFRNDNLISLEQIEEMQKNLQPGDILLTRSNWYLSNVGLPGFWPHSILYLGSMEEFVAYFENAKGVEEYINKQFGVTNLEALIDKHYKDVKHKWQKLDDFNQPGRALEAVAEGVILKSLPTVITADYAAALRVNTTRLNRLKAILNALNNFGKPYDFAFDIRNDSSSVCSELVYKAYSAVIPFPVKPRQFGTNWFGVATNDWIKNFDEELKHKKEFIKNGKQPFWEFVYFLDGKPKAGVAVVRGEKALAKTWRRTKWDWKLSKI